MHRTDADFPVAWTKTYGKGRVFYSTLGHPRELWDTPDRMRVDAFPVVADSQPKLAGTVSDFRLDVGGLRVTEGIAQRFARDAMNIVSNNRVQLALRALD